MSGVLRRGSLSFDLDNRSKRGSIESNLYGGYRDMKNAPTPEISVISFDFRRHSADLKKDNTNNGDSDPIHQLQIPVDVPRKPSDDPDSDIISNFIGHYGKWNFIWTFVLSLFQITPTFQMFAFVFQTADKDFWCARPQNMMDMNASEWKNLTQTTDSCSIWNIDFSSMDSIQSLFNYMATSDAPPNYTQCTQFEFDGDQSMTLVQEFGLVCSKRQLLSVVEMCFLAGAAVGSVSSGWISDKFGRKHTLMSFALLQTTFGTLLAFSSSLAMYMALRVIIGFASMTVAVVSFVLVVELVSGKWRTVIGILNILPVAVTYVLTAGISYFVRDWRTLQLVISLPWFAILCIWYCVPESPRWLLARGRLEELYAIVERAARLNGTTLPANYKKSLEAAVPPSASSDQNAPTSVVNGSVDGDAVNPSMNDTNTKAAELDANASPLVVVFSRTYLRTTCLTLVVWLTLIIIYFGLTLHLSNLGGNIYVNTAIAGAVEAVSICLSVFVVLKLGIRLNLIAYMLIPGICCLAVNIVPKGDENLIYVIALAMIAKCIIGANNAIIPTYTAMQYPTVVRNFGVGMGNLAAGVALILVPYMWLLEHIDPLLPMSIMGVCGLIGAIALAMMKDVHP
ncbi:organic cation transporter protein [Musca domestica]|uniref:Organic cation transporter protein isoform X1 n=1 Tax=Musca domestica TaxID=7370 RepID=A0A1I8N8U2_MUSDO|nr:organic cation transporter protein [Musca domestica]